MRRGRLAAWIAFALLVSGCLGPTAPTTHSEHAHHEVHNQGHEHAPHAHEGDVLALRDWDPERVPAGGKTPPFPLEEGTRPTRDQALDFPDQYASLTAQGDGGLDRLREQGHLKGAGTPEDPYVIERVRVTGDLTIASTGRALVLREAYIEGTLRLNYAGERVYVHHVYAKDLRVNENVRRAGNNTGGLFHDNHFSYVGQIRHFIGEFRHNVVGPAPADAVREFLGDAGTQRLPDRVVFNLDGFHDAFVHHNEFHGQVEIKLHGHNHGDCFACPVHDHARPEDFPDNHTRPFGDERARSLGMRSHHSVRYAALRFEENMVRVASGAALRYHDTDHGADDRTATSEPNPFLEDPHLHVVDVTLRANRLEGGGLEVDVFNAPDARHPLQNRGALRVLDNRIAVSGGKDGPRVGVAARVLDGVDLAARGNLVTFPTAPRSPLDLGPERERTGFVVDRARTSNLSFEHNRVEDATHGVYVRDLDRTVRWRLVENDFDAPHAWRGERVAHPPEERP